MRESAVRFGDGRALIGVLTKSASEWGGAELPGVIFLNAGLVHRVGTSRLHVTLARRLAARGLPALRFDLSGIGDSEPSGDALSPARRWTAETRRAMDFLAAETGATRFVLIGHCSGAAVSYRTAAEDARVVGIGLLNPPGPVLPRHFLRTFSSHPNSWRRLFARRARLGDQLGRLLWRTRTPAREAPHDVLGGLRALAERGVDLLLVYSEWDPGYDYFQHVLRRGIEGTAWGGRIRSCMVPGADHVLSLVSHQKRVVGIVDDWAERICGLREPEPASKRPVPAERVAEAP